MKYLSKVVAAAGFAIGLTLAGAPADAQQPAAKQAAPAPTLKPASPAALAAAKEILAMKNANAMYASAVPRRILMRSR
jgi:hypothetical protein